MSWKKINEEIRKCKSIPRIDDRIKCLNNLLKIFGEDGMILYVLGEEYEALGDLEKALKHYEKAYEKFPLPEYKQIAKNAVNKIKTKIKEPTPITQEEKILYVVNCTKKKIWDEDPTAPPYIPARFAYRGKSFLEFLKFIKPIEHTCRWLILSAKYGFIEPWHPISNYNVTFDDPNTGPISDETLRNQVLYQTRWPGKKPLKNFTKILVHGNQTYYQKTAKAYQGIAKTQQLELKD